MPTPLWKPGQSGNPSGRPKKDKAVTEYLKEHAMDAAQAWVRIVNDPKAKHADQIAAATAIIHNVYGKPTQRVELETNIASDFLQAIRMINSAPVIDAEVVDQGELPPPSEVAIYDSALIDQSDSNLVPTPLSD